MKADATTGKPERERAKMMMRDCLGSYVCASVAEWREAREEDRGKRRSTQRKRVRVKHSSGKREKEQEKMERERQLAEADASPLEPP